MTTPLSEGLATTCFAISAYCMIPVFLSLKVANQEASWTRAGLRVLGVSSALGTAAAVGTWLSTKV